jgi:hypothetical protein
MQVKWDLIVGFQGPRLNHLILSFDSTPETVLNIVTIQTIETPLHYSISDTMLCIVSIASAFRITLIIQLFQKGNTSQKNKIS